MGPRSGRGCKGSASMGGPAKPLPPPHTAPPPVTHCHRTPALPVRDLPPFPETCFRHTISPSRHHPHPDHVPPGGPCHDDSVDWIHSCSTSRCSDERHISCRMCGVRIVSDVMGSSTAMLGDDSVVDGSVTIPRLRRLHAGGSLAGSVRGSAHLMGQPGLRRGGEGGQQPPHLHGLGPLSAVCGAGQHHHARGPAADARARRDQPVGSSTPRGQMAIELGTGKCCATDLRLTDEFSGRLSDLPASSRSARGIRTLCINSHDSSH